MKTNKPDEIKIDKNVPIPNPGHKTGTVSHALKNMNVGDSFLWKRTGASNIHSIAKYVGVKITTRIQEDGQHRVWRTA